MSFAVRGARTRLMSINQGKRRKETKELIENRNVNIITDAYGKKLVLINDIRFKGNSISKDTSGTFTKSLKMQSIFLSGVNCRKNTRNQRAAKALWEQMQK